MTAPPAHHVDDPNVRLATSTGLTKRKPYLSVAGLFVTLMFKDGELAGNEARPNSRQTSCLSLGSVCENTVAQTPPTTGYSPVLPHLAEGRSARNHEHDFVPARGMKSCPAGAKSSCHGTHASLDALSKKYARHVGSQHLVYTKELRKDGGATCVSTCMAMRL